MTALRRALDIVERHADIHVLPGSWHGCVEYRDLARNGFVVETIYDVGANVGQAASKFLRVYPQAKIYCFEPVSTAFSQLHAAFADNPRIVLNNCALGEKEDRRDIYVRGPTTHSFVLTGDAQGTESVTVRTLDEIMRANRTPRVDLLKIDVEGFEMSVLEGGREAFANGAIRSVLIEVGFDPRDQRHTLFERVRDFLAPYGLDLFGFYNQSLEYSGERKLRFADACFVLNR